MVREKIYRGKIGLRSYGESDDDLFVGDADEPFAEQFEDDLDADRIVTVSYYVSDTEMSEAALTDNLVRMLSGDTEALYTQRYSELTGYLWTDAELKIGGHDLLAELESEVGRWLYLRARFGPAEDAP